MYPTFRPTILLLALALAVAPGFSSAGAQTATWPGRCRVRRRRRHRQVRSPRRCSRDRRAAGQHRGDRLHAGRPCLRERDNGRVPGVLRAHVGTAQGAHPSDAWQSRLPDRRGRPYFEYFGDAAGPAERGYYSFDLGAWHIISLNSSCRGRYRHRRRWLREDLAAHPVDCVLAYWHEPVFSSGPHTPEKTMQETWSILYKAGADIVMNGARPPVRAVRAARRPRQGGRRRDPTIHRRDWRGRGVQVREDLGEQRGARQQDATAC